MNISKIPKTRREREIWEACDELWEELRVDELPISELTGEKLKAKLIDMGYKRGNQGQIYQYRNSWQLSRGIEENEDLVCEERSAFLSEKVQKAVELLFKEIQTEAEEKVTKAQRESDKKIKEYSNKYEVIKKEHELLQNQLTEASEELAVIKQANSDLASQLTKENHNHNHTKEKLNSAENKYIQLSEEAKNREQNLNERNEKDKKELLSKIDNLMAAHKKELSEQKEYSENKRHQYIVEIDNLKIANSKLDKQLEKSTILEQRTNNANNELKQSVKSFENVLEDSRKINAELTHKLYSSENMLAETRGELKQLRLTFEEYKNRSQELQKQLLDYKERAGRLEEQLSQAKMNKIMGDNKRQS